METPAWPPYNMRLAGNEGQHKMVRNDHSLSCPTRPVRGNQLPVNKVDNVLNADDVAKSARGGRGSPQQEHSLKCLSLF